jgi:hypothetical protein
MTDITIAPSANEAVWHAAAAALYDGDIDTFLAHWRPDGRYEVAYPIAGMPSVVAGPHHQRGRVARGEARNARASCAGSSPASRRSRPGSASTTCASTPRTTRRWPSSRSA